MPLPQFTPADLTLLPAAFDHEDFIFELKMDGFRSLAYVDEGETRLVSRTQNPHKRFTDIAAAIRLDLGCTAVLDGEIVCLDSTGRAQFYDLLRGHRGTAYYVFDVLRHKGRDLRSWPLTKRKELLRRSSAGPRAPNSGRSSVSL